jgi:hypothetical protein
MSGGDGMDSDGQVPIIKRVWAPVVTSYHARHLLSSFPEVLALGVPALYRKPLGEAVGNPRVSSARGRDRAG